MQAVRGIQFQVTGGGSINVQDLVPYKDGGSELADYEEFYMWWWDATNGKNVHAVWNTSYYDPDDPKAEDDWVEEYCWTTRSVDDPTGEENEYKYDDNAFGPEVKGKKFNPTTVFQAGQAFFMKPGCADPSVTVSGEVIPATVTDATKTFEAGFLADGLQVMVCNPFPTAVPLQSIVPFKGEELADYEEFYMWWWDATNGKNVHAVWNTSYYDPNDPAAEDDWVEEYCWTTRSVDDPTGEENEFKYDDKAFGPDDAKGNKVNPSVSFEAGNGFWTKPGCAEPTLAFPNPFYKGE